VRDCCRPRDGKLEAGGRGELILPAQAPGHADGVRRLLTAEIEIDGNSQRPISEALVTVLGRTV
jgi:hypothetical protein